MTNYFSYRVQPGSIFCSGPRDRQKDAEMGTGCPLARALRQELPRSLGSRIKTFLVPLATVTTPLHLERAREGR